MSLNAPTLPSRLLVPTIALGISATAFAQPLVTHIFEDGTPASAAQVNTNFDDLSEAINQVGVIEAGIGNYAIGSDFLNLDNGANPDSGNRNTAFGDRALNDLQEGTGNTAVGWRALTRNTSGIVNTAMGAGALDSNTSGSRNVGIGSAVMDNNTEGGDNTAIGYAALVLNRTGVRNTAVGSLALGATTGNDNTGVGTNALGSQTTSTGSANVAVGNNVLDALTTATFSTGVGLEALGNVTTGIQNSGFGSYTFWSATTGRDNAGLGFSAGFLTSTGSDNTAVGSLAMNNNRTGSQNTIIGAKAETSTDNLSNATALGYQATVNASNKTRLGNASVTVIEGQVPYTSTSDARLKERIVPLEQGLALVRDLKPVHYHRIGNPNRDIEMGLLAQEVASALSQHGFAESGMVHQADANAPMSLRYNDLMAPMIKAIQELDMAVKQRDERVVALEAMLVEQQRQMAQLIEQQEQQIARFERMITEGRVASR